MKKKMRIMLWIVAFLGSFISFAHPVSGDSKDKLNFVIFLTDDQRWDTVGDGGVNAEIKQLFGRSVMPIVEEKLAKNGVLFTNAFVTTPLCCPDRGSLLSGGFYAQHTGILGNELPNGGGRKFTETGLDRDTLATRLQEAGYQTALIGKYLNEYSKIAPYVPPGWTKFFATSNEKFPKPPKEKKNKGGGGQEWFNPCAVRGSSQSSSPSQGKLECYQNRYLTDLQRDEALSFIDGVGDAPFFLYFSTNAPHAPAIPAKSDENLFSGYKYRGRAYGEDDLSDKPAWVREEATKYRPAKEDNFHLGQLRSLQAVDRAIGKIVDKITKMGKLDKTVFIFTADNGFLWGEHRLTTKAKPYEESIRVPLVVVIPGEDFRKEGPEDSHLITVNLDLPQTIFALAGIERQGDGLSILPLLREPFPLWRGDFLIEGYGGVKGSWAGLHTEQYKYVEYASENQEKELYDLKEDPFELESRHNQPSDQEILEQLKAQLEPLKGLIMTVLEAPKAEVNKLYSFQLRAWGGRPPYTWSITQGPDGKRDDLPEGLSLDSATGLISGSLQRAEKRTVWIKVEDSQIVQPADKVQSFVRSFVFGPSLLSYSPMVAAVTPDSAKVWFRTNSQAKVQVEYSLDPDFDNDPLISGVVTTTSENDFTGTISLSHLSSETIYFYRILIDGRPAEDGPFQFKTFPLKANSVKIGILTDLDSKEPALAFSALAKDTPEVVLVLGDWDHRDVSNLAQMRLMHRQTRGPETAAGKDFKEHILSHFPVAHVWDDHDYAGNNSDKTFKNKTQAIKAYDEYWPGYERPNPAAGTWHKFNYGDLVEVFMLDLRSQRDIDSYNDPRYVPSPEPNPSRDLIRHDPCRSLLDGDSCPEGKSQGQKDWLKQGLLNSTAKWKIIASTVPFNPTLSKDDAWWDFKAEQEELLRFVRENNLSGVIVVSGDIHTGGAIDDGSNAGLPEMNVPTVNLGQEAHETCSLHNPSQRLGCGSWSAGFSAEGRGYGLITLSPASALLEAKDEEGKTRFDLTVRPLPTTPKADFTAFPLNGKVPLTVQFTDLSTGAPISWLWDFGDGGTSNEQNPTHTYINLGNYSVSLTISGKTGEDKTIKPDFIKVTESGPPHRDRAPHARAGRDQTVRSGTLVRLDGSKSFDPDGDTLSYSWSQLSGPEVNLSGKDNAIASFLAPEVKEVTEFKFELTVSAKGKSDKDRTTVLVKPALPAEISLEVPILTRGKCSIEVRLLAKSPSLLASPLDYRIKDLEGKIVKKGRLTKMIGKDEQENILYETVDELVLPIGPYTAELEVEGKILATTNFAGFNSPTDTLRLELDQRNHGGETLLRLKATSTQQPKACLRYRIFTQDKARIVAKGILSFVPRRNKEKGFYLLPDHHRPLELRRGNYQLFIESSYGGKVSQELKIR